MSIYFLTIFILRIKLIYLFSGSLTYLDVKIPPKHLLQIALSCRNLQTLKQINVETYEDFLQIVEARKSTLKEIEICSDLNSEAFDLLQDCQMVERLTIHSRNFRNIEVLTKLNHLATLQFPVRSNCLTGD